MRTPSLNESGPYDMIDDFNGKHAFLNSYYTCPIKYNGFEYTSVGYAFDTNMAADEKIRTAYSVVTILRNKVNNIDIPLRTDWDDSKKVQVMESLTRQKFLQLPLLKKLLATGDAILIQGNGEGHEKFWGNCTCYDCGPEQGYNYMGQILMKIRSEMQNFKMCF